MFIPADVALQILIFQTRTVFDAMNENRLWEWVWGMDENDENDENDLDKSCPTEFHSET